LSWPSRSYHIAKPSWHDALQYQSDCCFVTLTQPVPTCFALSIAICIAYGAITKPKPLSPSQQQWMEFHE
jgi:hypothetical protein